MLATRSPISQHTGPSSRCALPFEVARGGEGIFRGSWVVICEWAEVGPLAQKLRPRRLRPRSEFTRQREGFPSSYHTPGVPESDGRKPQAASGCYSAGSSPLPASITRPRGGGRFCCRQVLGLCDQREDVQLESCELFI